LPLSEPPDSKEIRQREHRDIAHPINSEFRDYLQNEIFKKYEEEIGPLTESKEKQEIAEEEEAQEEVEKEQSESEEESQKQQEKETSKGKQPEGAKQQPKEEESEEDKPRL
jgi:DNA-binding cell septation regulator SpoVG